MPPSPEHWQESATAWRTTPRPRGWKALRAPALERDAYRCTWVEDGEQCTEPGTDADHIGDPDDHSVENLRTLCQYHHRKRTAMQARAARGDMPSRRRPRGEHPGLVTTTSTAPASKPEGEADVQGDVPPF
ncbi:HNH endonuclease signature motif containing protein [Streptomyces sp. NPDC006339]|uniref:HNH endonuclease n=1 Tax=Streptomyces sp. NPDC006339 TaxID=3156755 RepID=UPI0033A9FB0C